MLSTIPFDQGKITPKKMDNQMLRAAIIGELDAINLYEQLADLTGNDKIKKVLLDIVKEEKTHIGELQTLLVMLDSEQKDELEKGRKEVEKTIS